MTPSIYTTPECPYCHELKDWLDDLSVSYDEIDASELEEIEIVPEFHLGDDVIIGPDYSKILTSLKSHGLID